MKIEAYQSFAVAKSGATLPGGVLRWESAPFSTRDKAKACLEAFTGQCSDSVSYTGIKPVKVSPDSIAE